MVGVIGASRWRFGFEDGRSFLQFLDQLGNAEAVTRCHIRYVTHDVQS